MEVPFYIVDAFVDPEKPFSGNPAAVVILENDVMIFKRFITN